MDLVYQLKSSLAKNKALKKENQQLKHELEMALDSLKWARDKLVEAQSDLQTVKMLLVRAEERVGCE